MTITLSEWEQRRDARREEGRWYHRERGYQSVAYSIRVRLSEARVWLKVAETMSVHDLREHIYKLNGHERAELILDLIYHHAAAAEEE